MLVGRKMQTVQPWPGLLFSAMPPEWARTRPSATDNPKPLPVDLVEKKGSKILSKIGTRDPAPGIRNFKAGIGPGDWLPGRMTGVCAGYVRRAKRFDRDSDDATPAGASLPGIRDHCGQDLADLTRIRPDDRP